MKDYKEIIDHELDKINRNARSERKRIRSLLPGFDYRYYSYGEARIDHVCDNFEEYLEVSSKLPTKDVELHSYDLYWYEDRNDSVVIKHRHMFGKDKYRDYIDYVFIVREPERTLELLTEGKCKIIEKTTPAQEPVTYTALSCSDK